jgi:hypothetical protein
MATKKTSKKNQTTKSKSKKAVDIEVQQARAELGPNELIIKFDHPHQILPKLLELARHFSDAHLELLTQPGVATDVLGGARARLIVSNCAHSTAWGATLSELALNPLIFRNCVASGVSQAGYVPPNIPASPNTRLIDVVLAIQGAPHQ